MEVKKDADQSHIDQVITLADASFAGAQLVEAATLFEATCLMLREAGVNDGPKLSHCLTRLAEIHTAREDPLAALEFIDSLRRLDDTLANRRWYVSVLDRIAGDYEKQGAMDLAEQYYTDALGAGSQLLAVDDPLLDSIRDGYGKIQKSKPKSAQLTTSDRIKLLGKLFISQPIEKTYKQLSGQKLEKGEKIEKAVIDRSAEKRDSAKSPPVHKADAKAANYFLIYALPLMLLAVLVGCLLKVAFVSPVTSSSAGTSTGTGTKSSTVDTAASLQGVQFESCDKKSTFQLINNQECRINNPRVHTQCHYTIVDASPATLTSLVPGYLKRDELWYHVNAGGVMDPDKTLLYSASAPEHAIVKQMWWYADFAQKWYEQKHAYPADADRWKSAEANFHFLNPFTLQQDVAALVAPKEIHSDPTWSVRPSNIRAYPHWRPGGISCICIDGTKFFIHGCGRDGRPLTASDPTRFFVIECQNGRNVTREALQKADQEKQTAEDLNTNKREMRVFVCSGAEQAAAFSNFRSLCCTLVWLGAILSSLWSLSAFRLKLPLKHKVLSVVFVLVSGAALAFWYVLAFN